MLDTTFVVPEQEQHRLVAYYAGAFHSIVQGGDHAMQSFPEFVPDLVDWAMGDGAGKKARP